MDIQTAIKSCLNKYATFSGRATRSEYWWWVLTYILVTFLLTLVGNALTPIHPELLANLFIVAVFLPTLAVAVRRLHDIDKSGWWILIGLIPIVGTIISIIWYCTKGTLGPNRFGIGL